MEYAFRLFLRLDGCALFVGAPDFVNLLISQRTVGQAAFCLQSVGYEIVVRVSITGYQMHNPLGHSDFGSVYWLGAAWHNLLIHIAGLFFNLNVFKNYKTLQYIFIIYRNHPWNDYVNKMPMTTIPNTPRSHSRDKVLMVV